MRLQPNFVRAIFGKPEDPPKPEPSPPVPRPSLPRVLVFGGCNIRGPVFRAIRPQLRDPESNWDGVPNAFAVSGVPFFTYTLGEMFQAVCCYQGRSRLPENLYPVCNMRPERAPSPANSPLGRTDLVLAEPNTSIEIEFEGFYLNRAPVMRLLAPMQRLDRAARKLCSVWYNKGIVAMDEDTRREVSDQLAPLVPTEHPNFELTLAVLRGARGRKCAVRHVMGELAAALDVPLAIVMYTWAYMPDGRAISWPGDFQREIRGAAQALNLPIFDPRVLVEQAGTPIALKEDLRHYTNEFMPQVAKGMLEFALAVPRHAVRPAPRPLPPPEEPCRTIGQILSQDAGLSMATPSLA